MRGFIVGALAVAVVVLGYLYWQETKNDVSIKLEAAAHQHQLNQNGGMRAAALFIRSRQPA